MDVIWYRDKGAPSYRKRIDGILMGISADPFRVTTDSPEPVTWNHERADCAEMSLRKGRKIDEGWHCVESRGARRGIDCLFEE